MGEGRPSVENLVGILGRSTTCFTYWDSTSGRKMPALPATYTVNCPTVTPDGITVSRSTPCPGQVRFRPQNGAMASVRPRLADSGCSLVREVRSGITVPLQFLCLETLTFRCPFFAPEFSELGKAWACMAFTACTEAPADFPRISLWKSPVDTPTPAKGQLSTRCAPPHLSKPGFKRPCCPLFARGRNPLRGACHG